MRLRFAIPWAHAGTVLEAEQSRRRPAHFVRVSRRRPSGAARTRQPMRASSVLQRRSLSAPGRWASNARQIRRGARRRGDGSNVAAPAGGREIVAESATLDRGADDGATRAHDGPGSGTPSRSSWKPISSPVRRGARHRSTRRKHRACPVTVARSEGSRWAIGRRVPRRRKPGCPERWSSPPPRQPGRALRSASRGPDATLRSATAGTQPSAGEIATPGALSPWAPPPSRKAATPLPVVGLAARPRVCIGAHARGTRTRPSRDDRMHAVAAIVELFTSRSSRPAGTRNEAAPAPAVWKIGLLREH